MEVRVRKKTCIHYTGELFSDKPLCRLGINVRKLGVPAPCWNGNAGTPCGSFQAPTDEQIAEDEKKSTEVIARMLKGAAAIEEWEKAHGRVLHQKRDISCPNCLVEGALLFLRSDSHLYAECSTPDCVKFRGNYRGGM